MAERSRFGDWECDLLMGPKNRSRLGVLTERLSRFTILVPMPSSNPEAICRAYAEALLHVPARLRLTVTCDRGYEMAAHAILA